MKFEKNILLVALIIICHFMLIGCVGRVKPYVPEGLPKVSSDKARIVLTRQSQLSSPGPYIFFDIGENIEPNALLSGRLCALSMQDPNIILVPDFTSTFSGTMMAAPTTAGIKPEDTGITLERLVKEDINEFFFVDLLWCDSKTIRAMSCGNDQEVCERSCDKGFIAGDIALVWESGIAFGMKGDFYGIIVKVSKDTAKTDLPIELVHYLESIDITQIRNGDLEKVTIIQGKEGFRIPVSNATLAFTKTPGRVLFKTSKSWGSWENVHKYVSIIDNRQVHRNVEVVGSLQPGKTVVWERDPGVMRLGAVCENIRYGSSISPHNMQVEAGKTYYIDFQVKSARGAFWTHVKTE